VDGNNEQAGECPGLGSTGGACSEKHSIFPMIRQTTARDISTEQAPETYSPGALRCNARLTFGERGSPRRISPSCDHPASFEEGAMLEEGIHALNMDSSADTCSGEPACFWGLESSPQNETTGKEIK